MLRYFCFLTVILGVKSAAAPFIKPCKLGDNACLVESAQAALPTFALGVPDLGIKSMDPMELKEVKSDAGGLHLIFTNTFVKGMKNCAADEAKLNLKKGKLSITIRCTVKLVGDYNIDGQLLLLPVQGKGPYVIHIKDIIIKAYADVHTIQGPDGEPHWEVIKHRHTFEVKTHTDFKFQNLFNGNKVLAAPVELFLNQNWRDVMKDMAPPIVAAIVENVVDGVKALFNSVSADKLFIA